MLIFSINTTLQPPPTPLKLRHPKTNTNFITQNHCVNIHHSPWQNLRIFFKILSIPTHNLKNDCTNCIKLHMQHKTNQWKYTQHLHQKSFSHKPIFHLELCREDSQELCRMKRGRSIEWGRSPQLFFFYFFLNTSFNFLVQITCVTYWLVWWKFAEKVKHTISRFE